MNEVICQFFLEFEFQLEFRVDDLLKLISQQLRKSESFCKFVHVCVVNYKFPPVTAPRKNWGKT
jgi:hypothetical protein